MEELCGRPQNFGIRIQKNLATMVAPQDTLIHLGDVIFYNYPSLKGILDSIPGRKILVRGNHDSKSNHWYMNNGFSYCADMIVQDNIIYSHRPTERLPSGVDYNIHGHFHNKTHRERPPWYDKNVHLLFVLEHHYKPIGLQEFMAKHEKEIRKSSSKCSEGS